MIFIRYKSEKQLAVIERLAHKFHDLQNTSKMLSAIGDLRESQIYSSKSYKVLHEFAIYCSVVDLDTGGRPGKNLKS
jgi:hypothetical protein